MGVSAVSGYSEEVHGNLVCGVATINGGEVTGFYKEFVSRAGAGFHDVPNFFKGRRDLR